MRHHGLRHWLIPCVLHIGRGQVTIKGSFCAIEVEANPNKADNDMLCFPLLVARLLC